MKEEGLLSDTEYSIRQLERLNLTDSQQRDAVTYEPGQIVEFHRIAKGAVRNGVREKRFKSGKQWEVLRREEDAVIVKKDGVEKQLPLDQADKFSVFEMKTITLSIGDRVRFTENVKHRGQNFLNSDMRIVVSVDEDRITFDKGGMGIPQEREIYVRLERHKRLQDSKRAFRKAAYTRPQAIPERIETIHRQLWRLLNTGGSPSSAMPAKSIATSDCVTVRRGSAKRFQPFITPIWKNVQAYWNHQCQSKPLLKEISKGSVAFYTSPVVSSPSHLERDIAKTRSLLHSTAIEQVRRYEQFCALDRGNAARTRTGRSSWPR
jgi:plastocyanin